MQIEVRHLRVVEAIERLGSMTRAAEVLFLSQPAVSNALRELERRLGVELFRRKGRGLEVTAAGKRLASRARNVLAELQAAEAELVEDTGASKGVLRMATECYTCYHWLPSVLSELQEQLPNLRLELGAGSTRCPVEAILEGEVDFAIVFTPTSKAALELVPLFSNEVVAIVAPHHPLAGKPYLQAEDLREEHILLHFEPESSILMSELLRPAGIEPAGCSELRLTEAIVETVKAGLGVGALARWAAEPHLEAGSVCALPITESGTFRQWWACYLKASANQPGIVELVRLIREQGLARLS